MKLTKARKPTDIIGYRIGNETVCLKCAGKEELQNLEKDKIITASELEGRDDLYICDRHKGTFLF